MPKTVTTPAARWVVAPEAPAALFARFADYPRPVVQMLYNRDLTEPEAVERFLNPSYERDLHSPTDLGGIREAVHVIRRAIAADQRIVIHGDYDADGLTATALLTDVLRKLGADVSAFVPSRYAEGYGVSWETLTRLCDEGVGLVITVDCGISSAAEIAAARKRGLKVVVTDHHLPPPKVPVAEAVVNPNLPGETYPNKALTGVGVAFKLAQALLAASEWPAAKREATEKWLLDLVAIGTVTDVASLTGENRALVRFGLLVLARTRRAGLCELIRQAGLSADRLTSGSIGFSIGPRLNAPGRLEHARDALRLLTTDSRDEARALAQRLERRNAERQALTNQALDEARRKLPELTEDDRIIVIDGSWLSGVVGLVAGRLSQEFSRPALVIERGRDVSRGSARSIAAFNVVDALRTHRKFLQTYGGHAQAAGFSLSTERLDDFRKRLQDFARQHLTAEDLRPTMKLEAEIRPDELTWPLVSELRRFEPFGVGNPRPQFLLRRVVLEATEVVGRDRAHLKLATRLSGGSQLTALAFRMAERREELARGRTVDLVGHPVPNEWNGRQSVEWHVTDFRPC